MAFAAMLLITDPLWMLVPAGCLLGLVWGWRLFPAYRGVALLMAVLFAMTLLLGTLAGRGPAASAGLALRLAAIIGTGVAYLAVTRPEETVWSMERVGVPYRVAFSLGLALRFLPLFLGQARRIREAQLARGLETGRRGLVQRARAHLPLVAPVILSALRRADRIAVALEGRGFGGSAPRTSWRRPRFGWQDLVALLLAGSLLALAVALRVTGGG